MNNPLQMLQALQNPQQFIENMMSNSAVMQNPILNNAITLAQNRDEKGLYQIAQNICKTNGKDFATEFEKFKKQIGRSC